MRDPRYFSHAWWNHTYLARGRYAEQLERWLELFPREQLLILPSDELLGRAGARPRAACSSSSARRRTSSTSYPRVFERRVRADGAANARAARGRVRRSRTGGSTSCSAATSAGRSAAPTARRRKRHQAEAASKRYGRASPSSSASQPPSAGPTTLPAAQAPFIAPNTSAAAIPRRSAASVRSVIPGV